MYSREFSLGSKIVVTDFQFSMYAENEIEEYRATSLSTKEPETNAWIKSFKNDCLFYDVGANVGVFSLLCKMLHPNSVICSFEPHRKNLNRLLENVSLNGWRGFQPRAVCAVGDIDSDVLFDPGSDIEGCADGVMYTNTPRSYMVPIYRLDSLVRIYGIPDYIKIDVDGGEGDVIKGATATLRNKGVKGVLIEINRNKEYIMKSMMEFGFTTDNEFNTMSPHSRERREAAGIACENIVFTRG